MFKKFKDKLAEEMKQSPARLQASVQQLAQAVVSPALSNSSIQGEVSASNDNFSLTEDGDETPKNTPTKHSFQRVDLMSPSPNRVEVSRRSSVSSVTSDASSLFPMYESPPIYHFQSDMDQSASEVDDNISPHLDRVTKDQLYSAYRKVQAKYHKYRGRYTDLAAHYRELDRAKTRLESVLVETQDKVLRRITDLKEQCQLEQQAKAHLEEALRNDIEEKDHIINTLNTKVKLLQQASGPTLENSVSEDDDRKKNSKVVGLIDPIGESSNSSVESSALSAENTQLKDKLKKLESLVLRYKESLKRNKEKFTEVTKEKNILESDYEALKNSTAERVSTTEDELNAARIEIERLTERVDTLHKREEESAISLAENKLSVHRELEEKEEQIKQLRIDLKHSAEDREHLCEILARYKAELGRSKSMSHGIDSAANLAADDGKNAIARDSFLENETVEETVMRSTPQTEMKRREQVDRGREIPTGTDENNASEEIVARLKERELEFQELRRKLDELEERSVEYKHDRETLQAELTSYKLRYAELRNEHDARRIVTEEKRKNADAMIEKLQATVQSLDKELENMRNALIDRDQVCENYNKKVQQYAAMLEKAKRKMTEQETRIKSLEDASRDESELSETREELESKRTELGAALAELELCRSTIDDFKNKVEADSSAISLLKKERSDLTNHLVYYRDCVRRLKQDCANINHVVREELSNRKDEISDLNATFAVSLAKLEEENAALNSRMNELQRTKMNDSERFASKETELNWMRSELDKITNLKYTLETELKGSDERLRELTLKSERYDELDTTNNKLMAEIDNLHFKIHDLETRASRELTESRQQTEILRERLRALEKLESTNRELTIELDDLKKELARASRTSEQVDDLSAKLREATRVIDSLRSEENGERNALREESRASRSEITRLQDNLTEREEEAKIRDEKMAEQEQHIARLISTCDSHVQTIEEHVRKYLNLEEEYLTTREDHAKQTAELMENNKVLQETINVKLVQLKKTKIVKERLSKRIEEMSAELDELKTKNAELSSALEASEKRIELLKLESSQLAMITLENKDLKDKRNSLLSHNRKLRENEEALRQKIANHEKDIEELRNDVESYKSRVNDRNEETERLSGQLTIVNAQLESKDVELSALNERLVTSEKELRDLEIKLNERNVMKGENARLVTELKLLRDQVERIRSVEEKNTELESQLDDLIRKNADMDDAIRSANNELIAERTTLRDKIVQVERVNSRKVELQTHVDNLQRKLAGLEALGEENDRLRSELDALRRATDSSTELDTLKDLLMQREAEIVSLKDKNVDMYREIENLRRVSLEIDERTKETDTLRNSLVLAEGKVAGLQSKVESLSLVRANDASRAESEISETARRGDKLREENKRLEAQLDEALITFQAKETQMQAVNDELRAQTDQMRERLKTSEEEQGMRLKQLVKEFQAQLHDKEEELQAALEKRFDRQHNYESDLVQQYKEQLKDFQIELTEKSEQIESLVLEKKDAVAEKGKDIDHLVETIARIEKEHANEVKEVEKKWKAIVQQRIDNLQAKHEEELNELTKEWQNERKPDVQIDATSEELENTSCVAMAAIQTNTGSIHTLQQTLTSQRREIAELRKLVKLRHDTLEDSTEIEYLRNILFEYMMGRETMVLARVIAAVVKFDQEQTTKILKKEEDKLTLFGSLGLV